MHFIHNVATGVDRQAIERTPANDLRASIERAVQDGIQTAMAATEKDGAVRSGYLLNQKKGGVDEFAGMDLNAAMAPGADLAHLDATPNLHVANAHKERAAAAKANIERLTNAEDEWAGYDLNNMMADNDE